MENIASQIPANNPPKATAAAKPQRVLAGIDRALFAAFMNIDSAAGDARKKSPLLDEKENTPAPEGIVPKSIAEKLLAPKPEVKKAPSEKTPDIEAHEGEAAVIIVKHEGAEDIEVKVIALPVLQHALKDPQAQSQLKELLGLDETATEEEVLKLVVHHLREVLAFVAKVQEDDQAQAVADDTQPIDVSQAVLQVVAMLMATHNEKLSEAERKLRDGLLELSLIGISPAQDDAVDAAVARNLGALDAWKAAVAAATGGDAAIAADANTDKQDKAPSALHKDAAPAADTSARANTNATGGRSDVSLVNNQTSAGQTLPLLPTPLTGGQHRLPVAAQHLIGGSNLDVIARPLAGSAGMADAAARLARAKTPTPAPQVYEQVAIRINRMAKAGEKSISIQLNPAELGRVDVKLDFAKDGMVTARIMADNQQSLDLLKQDSRALERALEGAGLRLGQDGLQFDLRHGGDSAQKFAQQAQMRALWQEAHADMPLQSDEIIINVSPAAILADGRVDIQV